MPKTEHLYFKGKVKWCRPFTLDPWGNWKTDLYPIPEDLARIKQLKETSENGIQGIKTTIKQDEDTGEEYIQLRRPREKKYNGIMKGFAPPVVLDGSVALPDGGHPPLRDTNIGNGSDVTAKVEIYQYNIPTGPKGTKGRAIRWEGLRIDNLIPFTSKKDFDDIEERQTRGLPEQPAQLF